MATHPKRKLCFGTADENPDLIHESVKLGNYTPRFVEKTTVLGLVMDQKVNYIEHGMEIYRKIQFHWVSICKNTNRNWGFRQRVIRLEVRIATSFHYAGIIWINNRSNQEVEKVVQNAKVGHRSSISYTEAKRCFATHEDNFNMRIYIILIACVYIQQFNFVQ